MSKLMPAEVWPVVASVGVAVAASCYTLKRKWVNDPQTTFAKSRRIGGTTVAYGDVEEAKPFWSDSKANSISIFGRKENPIRDSKFVGSPEITVTFSVDGEGEEEEEEETEEEPVEELKVIASEDDIPPAPEAPETPKAADGDSA